MVSSDTPDSVDRFIHRREKYYHAVEGCAARLLLRTTSRGRCRRPGSVGTADAPIGDIPAVGVSKETGASLARRREGEDLTVAVNSTATTPDATSGNAVADLGPDTDDGTSSSSPCHVDAHDLAEGRWTTAPAPRRSSRSPTLSRPAKRSSTRERFVGFGAEEVGLVGSSQFAAGVDPDHVKAVVNVDSNVFGRTLKLDHHGFDPLEAAGERARATGSITRSRSARSRSPQRPLAVRRARDPRLYGLR